MKTYGHGTSPITMDMGCFKVYYREPHCGGNRMFLSTQTATLMDAVAEFNLLKGGFDTPLRVERFDTFGNHSDTWTMDGCYSVPRAKNGHPGEPYRRRDYKRAYRQNR